MERIMPELREGYSLSNFIGGLKDEIRLMVRMLKPDSLSQTVKIVKLQEQLIEGKKPKPFPNLSRTTKSFPNLNN